jgi:hypothetical protein
MEDEMTQDRYELYEEAWMSGKGEDLDYKTLKEEISEDFLESEEETPMSVGKKIKQFKEW